MECCLENALYIVATPIGNLEDITFRAIETLKNADIVACEDTRTTSVLLNKYDIKTRTISYHKYSEQKRTELFLGYLKEGKSIALVSDAGTPLISDPGGVLVQNVLTEGFRVIPIPGASAPIALLSAAKRQDEDFKFFGFLPKSKTQIEDIIQKNSKENFIFYESPNRLISTLEIIRTLEQEKKVTVGRELTKKFEEIKTGSAEEILDYYKNNPPKGEIVVLLHKNTKQNIELDEKIKKLKALNFKNKEIALILKELYDVSKNEIYEKLIG